MSDARQRRGQKQAEVVANRDSNALIQTEKSEIAKQQQRSTELSTQMSPTDAKDLMQNIGQVSGSMLEAIADSLKGAGGEAEFTERITIRFE